jgi:hypothetical protein
MLVFGLRADEASVNLVKALHSDNLSLGIIEQQGVFPAPKINLDGKTFTDFKIGDSTLHFTGFGLLKSNYSPTLIDGAGDPAFMFNIKLSGNTIEIGGNVRDLKFGDWADFINNMNKKSEDENK